MNPGRIAKFLTALAGAAAQVLALGILDDPARGWVSAAVAVLTAAAVYLTPNQEVAGGAA